MPPQDSSRYRHAIHEKPLHPGNPVFRRPFRWKGAASGLQGFPHSPDNIHHLSCRQLLLPLNFLIHQRFHFLQQMLRLQTVSKQHRNSSLPAACRGTAGKSATLFKSFFFKGIQELCIPQESALDFPGHPPISTEAKYRRKEISAARCTASSPVDSASHVSFCFRCTSRRTFLMASLCLPLGPLFSLTRSKSRSAASGLATSWAGDTPRGGRHYDKRQPPPHAFPNMDHCGQPLHEKRRKINPNPAPPA